MSNADTAVAEITALGELFGCESKAQEFVDLYTKYDSQLTERLTTVTPLNVYVEVLPPLARLQTPPPPLISWLLAQDL